MVTFAFVIAYMPPDDGPFAICVRLSAIIAFLTLCAFPLSRHGLLRQLTAGRRAFTLALEALRVLYYVLLCVMRSSISIFVTGIAGL